MDKSEENYKLCIISAENPEIDCLHLKPDILMSQSLELTTESPPATTILQRILTTIAPPIKDKSSIIASSAVQNSSLTMENKNKTADAFVINSHVISASVRPPEALIKKDGVKIVLRHKQPTFGLNLGQCVYWERFKGTFEAG